MDTLILLIHGCRCVCTCSIYPEQYDVFDIETGDQIGYLRLRHGEFRADAYRPGGRTVYSSRPVGHGAFDNDCERVRELSKAVLAIKDYVYG
jgi:hypothetical protein